MLVQPIKQMSNTTYQSNTNFKAYMPNKFYRHAEKSALKVEQFERKVLNGLRNSIEKIAILFSKLKSKITGKPEKDLGWMTRQDLEIMKTNPLLELKTIYNISKLMSGGKEVEINIENNELHDIVNDDEACIFIMNHDRQKDDPKLFAFFNALLTREYINRGLHETCPKPKILINKDIIDTTSENKQILAEALGAIGIDAGIHCADSFANGKIIAQLVNEIANNKTHLFIFPEGRMSIFENLNPQWKFQSGIANIVKAVLKKKEQVKVIPLGFAYKKDVGGINIGKPLFFKKEGRNILFKPGDVDKNTQDEKYVDFINNSTSRNGWYNIVENGEEINQREIGDYIAGILCESLTQSKIKAADSLRTVGTAKDTDTIYNLGDDINA